MNKVLLPIDLDHTDATGRAMAQAKSLAARADVAFVLLHVMDEIPKFAEVEIPETLLESQIAQRRQALADLAAKYGLGDGAEILVRRGRPQHVIVETAEEIGADLIVIPSHQPSAMDILLGSVAASVVRHAHCSVMVIR